MSALIRRLPWPEAPAARAGRGGRIWPVFLPFAGCPRRCLYCQQERQTGTPARDLESAFAAMQAAMAAAPAGRTWDELAFYGGSFTALPEAWIERFLQAAAVWKRQGRIRRVRCSTRPDAVDAASLARWKALGLDVVELGVQSFQEHALAVSGRGYAGETARHACGLVRQAGLGLGVQLMPGLPGQQPGEAGQDVAQALALRPEGIRLYPCLVLEDTALAARWRQGLHRPRPLEAMAWTLGRAVLRCWEAGVPVWRMGVLESPALATHILAGPRHPALGTMARSRAIFLWMRRHIPRREAAPGSSVRLILPRRASGEFWGVAGEMRPQYARLGVLPRHVAWHNAETVEIMEHMA